MRLDHAIEQYSVYNDLKQDRIRELVKLLESRHDNPDQLYGMQSLLADTYAAYQFDSTLHYLRANLELALQARHPERINETRIKIADLYTSAGYYLEAADLLDRQIDTTQLAGPLLGRYYATRLRFCNAAVEYFTNPDLVRQASASRPYYMDQVLAFYPSDSDIHQRHLADKLMGEKRYREAGEVIDRLLEREQSSSHSYAGYAYTKALIEGFLGHADAQICWLHVRLRPTCSRPRATTLRSVCSRKSSSPRRTTYSGRSATSRYRWMTPSSTMPGCVPGR